MKLIEPSERIVVKNAAMLIYGEPGVGKSTLGNSARDPIVLDYDLGQHRAKNRRRVIQPEGDTSAVLGWLEANRASFGDVVVDTGGRLVEALVADVIKDNPSRGKGGQLDQRGWGAVAAKFQLFKTRILALSKDLYILAHHREDRDGDVKILRPDIPGGAQKDILKFSEFVGFLRAGSNGTRELDFSPSDSWTGKNPCEWQPFKLPNHSDPAMKTWLGDLMAKGKEGLGNVDQDAIELSNAITEWAESIKDAGDGRALNALKRELADEKREAVVTAAWRLMLQRAKAIKVDYDKVAKKFAEPEVKEEAKAAEEEPAFS